MLSTGVFFWAFAGLQHIVILVASRSEAAAGVRPTGTMSPTGSPKRMPGACLICYGLRCCSLRKPCTIKSFLLP